MPIQFYFNSPIALWCNKRCTHNQTSNNIVPLSISATIAILGNEKASKTFCIYMHFTLFPAWKYSRLLPLFLLIYIVAAVGIFIIITFMCTIITIETVWSCHAIVERTYTDKYTHTHTEYQMPKSKPDE